MVTAQYFNVCIFSSTERLFTEEEIANVIEQGLYNGYFPDSNGCPIVSVVKKTTDSHSSPDSPKSPIYADFMKNAKN